MKQEVNFMPTLRRWSQLSVIVELDNLLHGKYERTREMLTRLAHQIRENELEERIDVLVAYDQSVRDRRIRQFTAFDAMPVRLIPTRGLHYFSLKNAGAAEARGELLLFVDSDCLPEPNWLREMLKPFDSHVPHVQVVTGNSYIDRDTFYAKTFALGWYFPSRTSDDDPLRIVPHCYANTLAMLREVFEKHPFPEQDQFYMAQGETWCHTLTAHGIEIFLNPRARVAHPPPVFLRSAIINGYDSAQVRRTRKPNERILGGALRSLRYHLGNMYDRTILERREVGLSRTQACVAMLIAGTYWGLWTLSDLAASWTPKVIPHRWLR